MEDKKKHLISLIDRAIILANEDYEAIKSQKEKNGAIDAAKTVLTNLSNIRINLLNGKIGSSQGSRLGLSKNLGDWSNNKNLLDLAYEIDDFYQKNL